VVIDIMLEPKNFNAQDWYSQKINYLVKLKKQLGDQKIDVIVKLPGDTRGIVATAEKEGIVL